MDISLETVKAKIAAVVAERDAFIADIDRQIGPRLAFFAGNIAALEQLLPVEDDKENAQNEEEKS